MAQFGAREKGGGVDSSPATWRAARRRAPEKGGGLTKNNPA